MNCAQVQAVLAKIDFAPSCIDMGWQWDVTDFHGQFGFLIRTTFQRPDTNTGAVSTGKGRWWHLEPDATAEAIVKTAFAACEQILKHELMEAFHYNGMRLFDPHHSINDLSCAVDHKRARLGE